MTAERWTAARVRQDVERDKERLFAPYLAGRPPNYLCDPRTKDMICTMYYLREKLQEICKNEADRIEQEWYFNRWSRSIEDLFELAAETLNIVLDERVEQNRSRLRRWG